MHVAECIGSRLCGDGLVFCLNLGRFRGAPTKSSDCRAFKPARRILRRTEPVEVQVDQTRLTQHQKKGEQAEYNPRPLSRSALRQGRLDAVWRRFVRRV